MDIEILYLADCPNVKAARLRVGEALAALGLTARIREIEVSSAADAVRLGMNGSPTVLVDGRDPFAGSAPSVACRLYRNGTAVEGAPSVEALVAALKLEGPADGTEAPAVMEPEACRGPLDGDVLRAGLGDTALGLAVAGFAALRRGRVCDPGQLLPDRRELAVQTASDLARLGRAEMDADGRLVGIHGLTLRRTRHAFEHDGRVHNTWCGFDSVGIPAALGLDATAATDCPTCGAQLLIDVRRGRVDGR